MLIGVTVDAVTVETTTAGPVALAPLQAGRLRAAIRDALDLLDRPDVAARAMPRPQRPRPTRKPRDTPTTPAARERMVFTADPNPTMPKFRWQPPDRLMTGLVGAVNVDHTKDIPGAEMSSRNVLDVEDNRMGTSGGKKDATPTHTDTAQPYRWCHHQPDPAWCDVQHEDRGGIR